MGQCFNSVTFKIIKYLNKANKIGEALSRFWVKIVSASGMCYLSRAHYKKSFKSVQIEHKF